MRFRQLRHFCAIVDCGSFSRAAGTVKIAQAALSRQIAELEAQIGVPLLHRTSRGVRVTRAGEVLYSEAIVLLNRLDRIPALVMTAQGAITGSVKLGLSSTFDPSLATAIVNACRDTLPQVDIKILAADSATLRARIEAKKLDLAIIFESPLSQPVLTRHALYRQKLFVVGAPDWIPPTGVLSLSDIAGLPLIAPSESDASWALFIHALAGAGFSPKIVAKAVDTPGVMAAVRAGLVAAVLPMGKVPDVDRKRLIRAAAIEPPLYVTASFVAAGDTPLSRAGDSLRVLIVSLMHRYLAEGHLAGTERIAAEVTSHEVPPAGA